MAADCRRGMFHPEAWDAGREFAQAVLVREQRSVVGVIELRVAYQRYCAIQLIPGGTQGVPGTA